MEALLALGSIIAAVALGLAAIVSLGRAGLDGQLGGLTSMLGGWRTQSWPHGVQEDDPEAGWAVHRERALPTTSWIEDVD